MVVVAAAVVAAAGADADTAALQALGAESDAVFGLAAEVKCKPCSGKTGMNPKDLDTRPDSVWLALQWGPLMNDKAAFVEADISGYSIDAVDSKDRILTNMAMVSKVTSSSTCCTNDLYSVIIQKNIKESKAYGMSKLMITPYFKMGVGSTARIAYLPMGMLTDVIVDVTAGLASTVKGSFTMKVSDVEEFKTNKAVNMALREAVADTIKGVEKDSIHINGISSVDVPTDNTRRLMPQPGSVKVDYTIMLPASYAGEPIKAASISPTKLMSAINTRIAAKGIVGVSVTEAPVIAVTKATSIGKPMATAGAHRNAALGFFAALLGLSALLK